jgi:hypothetical protein
LTEQPLLHTAHPVARTWHSAPGSSRVNLPRDWQRLLYLYAHLKRSASTSSDNEDYPSIEILNMAISQLSTEGVTSQQSQEIDPERLPDYEDAAKNWVKRYKENRKKKAAAKRKKSGKAIIDEVNTSGASSSTVEWTPSSGEIARLIFILETNSHSRDEQDQQDLQDPRNPPLPSSDTATLAQEPHVEDEDDEGNDKDEACGLWLVASMLNHSCRPNCTIHIPASSSQGGSPSLYLRCIRPINAGDELFISYHDEELMPTEDRQAVLAGRGFTCVCTLCSGSAPDPGRAAACSHCLIGVCSPMLIEDIEAWICDSCGKKLDAGTIDSIATVEEQWMEQWPAILEMVSNDTKPSSSLQSYEILRALANASGETPTTILSALSADLGLSPLHICHGHIYAFLKWTLFEQSSWLRKHFGQEGVFGVLFTMIAIVDRIIGPEPASEERRALGYWLAREAKDRLKFDLEKEEAAKWEKLRDEGFSRWAEGMKVLYGGWESA